MASRQHDLAQTDVEDFVAAIGARVRELRAQKALSRRALSEISGVSQRYLAQLESGSGNISVALLYRVACALGRSPEALLASDDHSPERARLLSSFDRASAALQAQALALLEDEQTSQKAARICLIGLRGAGKTTLGKALAEDLSQPFVELNAEVERLSGMAVGEVIALYGQEGYRRLERRALVTIIEEYRQVVLAVGGGIVSEPDTFDTLLRNFHTVWIKAAPQEHMDRVRKQGDERPMAGNPQAMQELRTILTSRETLYARADGLVDTQGRTVEQSVADLKRVTLSFPLEA